ncbi:MAG TPA: hypothetical protein VM386_01465 [Acidimicrobiales bacterium]|nr:hypothetical protein [Acidimicrobiales bacterium]
MVPILSLWAPILLAAVLVFVVSSLIHMVIGYHKTDFRKLPREAEVLEALRPFKLPPGEYVAPHAASRAAMNDPAYVAARDSGPVFFMTVIPPGPPSMGASLALWFLFALLVGVFAAYITGRALPAGANYLEVFRFAGTTAFAGYALALLQNSIWFKRSWGTTLKSVFDGLVYALLTAGAFGWLWPR